MVIEIMLGFLKQSDKKNIIGFFGDAMQCIYDKGVGDLNKYKFDGTKGEVYEVQKCQNRRNPSLVIDLANKIRTDGLVQEPSNDDKAPNMEMVMLRVVRYCLYFHNKKETYCQM